MTPTASLIMLAGIFYGAQYGGSTTSILMNLPGESATASLFGAAKSFILKHLAERLETEAPL
jgi:TctA family transporter